jgi:hypothetical protein
MTRRRKTLIWLAAIAWAVLLLAIAWPRIDFFLLTGRFSPVSKVEFFRSPVVVTNWSESGLHLADGREIQLPGIRKLPASSAALTEATKRGVEVDENGRVYGLVRVHHWCGNDPIREHIARVDIANMLVFVGEGEPISSARDVKPLALDDGGTFSEWGWNVSEFMLFQTSQAQGK